jgi:poly(3-hydroxybutyrate) depolymerase
MRAGRCSALFLVAVAFAGCGTDRHGAELRAYDIDSKAVGQSEPQRLVLPDDGDGKGRALLVFLHGRNGDAKSNLQGEFYEALADLGDRAPVVVFPDGGEDSYWHDRDGGAWGHYITSEVIPRALRESGADPKRVAIGGISMGGFGAYDVARLHPGRFCAVGGHSPAIWTEAGQTAPGAFDDAEDFAQHDLVAAARAGSFRPQHFWLDRGDSDPFIPGDAALTAAMGVKPHSYPGGHVREYWDAHWRQYLRFYTDAC